MWYALAHILEEPVPIIRHIKQYPISSIPPVVAPRVGNKPAQSSYVVHSKPTMKVHVIPAGLPLFMWKAIRVPKSDVFSEFKTLRYISRKTGMHFQHTGPDYALIGCKVPYGKPATVYNILYDIGHSYIPGALEVVLPNQKGGWYLKVYNKKP